MDQMKTATLRINPTHERDARWSAVDHYALKHLHPSTSPYYSEIQYAIELSEKEGLPAIEVSHLQGRFLKLQCMLLKAKNVLEVGTLGGVSSIWLASSSPECKVTTIEINPKHVSVASQAIKNAGLTERVEILAGAGNEVLPELRKEVDAGKRKKFEFVFIDADKPNNLNYLNEAVPMCVSGALIVVDNVVRKGQLASAEAALQDPAVAGARQVVEAVGKDSRLECTLLQTVGDKNYDGFLLCVVE